MESVHILPGEHLIFRQHIFIADHLLALLAFLFIDIVGDQHVQDLISARKHTKGIQNRLIRRIQHPVVAVNHLEKQAAGLFNSRIHTGAVAAVFLMDGFYDGGILFSVLVRNFCRFVGGAVIHDENLHILPARKQRIDAFAHVLFRIVAGYRNCQKFHLYQISCCMVYMLLFT